MAAGFGDSGGIAMIAYQVVVGEVFAFRNGFAGDAD
jgi:hypothetical protein